MRNSENRFRTEQNRGSEPPLQPICGRLSSPPSLISPVYHWALMAWLWGLWCHKRLTKLVGSAAARWYAAVSTPRRPANRRPLLLLIPWALFLAWTAWGTISNGGQLIGELAAPRPTFPSSAFLFNSIAFQFSVNLWGCLAGVVLGLIVANPFAWMNGKRLIFGCMAFAAVLGRLAGGGLLGMALYYLNIPAAFIIIAAPFALLFTGSLVIIGCFFIVLGAFSFLVALPVMLFNQIFAFEQNLHIYRHQARGLAGYITRAILWLRNEPLPEVTDETRGARFASPAEVSALRQADAPAAMVFGHTAGPLALQTDKHVLIMASTRSGKGVTLIIPHLLRYPGSAFVLDPKGENARATSRRRAELNAKVHVLDPFGVSGKPQARFNPLSRFTPENMEAESKSLAAALFVVGDRDRDYWTAAGQQLLATIILYVYVSPKIPPEKKDLPSVRRILLGWLKPALKEMREMDDAGGLLSDLATSFLETPERELGSIISTAQRQTEILDNPFIVASLSASGPGKEVDFKDWRSGSMTVYLCLSAPKFPVFNRWLRLVLTSALDEMTDTLAPPALPVCFMLDELATLGHLDAVENAVGLAAGYGIQLVAVFQDVAQMRDLYKGRWASFVGNAGVRALFNLDDYETAEYWSKFMGGRLVETHSRQEDIYGLSAGQHVGEALRPLMSPEELMMTFAAGKMLVLAQGAHPVVTDRVPYWKDPDLADLWDDPRAATGANKRDRNH